MKPDKDDKRKERIQPEEMALAARECRQPTCIHCGHPLDKVSETQYEYLTWAWNAEKGTYFQDAVGDSDKPHHDCSRCLDGCGVHDPDFADNVLIYY